MRPEILFPLFTGISALSGIGPRYAVLIEKLAGPRVLDLIWHLPAHFIQRNVRDSVLDVSADEVATLELEIRAHSAPPNGEGGGRNLPYKVIAADADAFIELIYFHARAEYLQRLMPVGETRLISGKIENRDGKRQMMHPDYVVPVDEANTIPAVEPVYPSTAGLPAKTLRRAIAKAIALRPELDEWLDDTLVRREKWPRWHAAIDYLHAGQRPRTTQNPGTEQDPATKQDPAGDENLIRSRERLAFDELFAGQLGLIVARETAKRLPGHSYDPAVEPLSALYASLPFTPTGDQLHAIDEISRDLASPLRMNRLLQGDVGSGKTLVALAAMVIATANGKQSAFMAPTELLARQHLQSLQTTAANCGLRIALLTGKMPAKETKATRALLASGEIDICIGTHALFQDGVSYHDLGLIIVDEQHRFGVAQRRSLQLKGAATEVLAMTATPIPRTLAMTRYGDMDVSRILEKPPGRRPVSTAKMPIDSMGDVLARLGNAMKADPGLQAYWVCPLVAESEATDLAAAEERHTVLSAYFSNILGPNAVSLVHGQMKSDEKQASMDRFVAGQTRILVATTVIEVGVDVPNASIMLIEQAERFGLSQMHQLRGRVGRGAKSSSCLLMYKTPLTKNAAAKIGIMLETEDGFEIAEEDLRLRGIGDVLGTRQTGMPEYKVADLDRDGNLLAKARKLAELTMSRAKNKPAAFPQPVKNLLYLFEKDRALKFRRT